MERVKVRRVGQRRSDRGQGDHEAEALALVPQLGELTGERRVASATPEGGQGAPAGREEVDPGQRLRADEALQRRGVALGLAVVARLERRLHGLGVEMQLVVADAS